MDDWLTERATKLGVSLSEHEAEVLLNLARIAAHSSGDRRNAPLLSYLVGLAVGRGGDFGELVETVE